MTDSEKQTGNLGAVQWPAAAIVHEIPFTALERWTLLSCAYSMPTPEGWEAAKKRKEIAEALAAPVDHYLYWDWFELSKGGIQSDEFNNVHVLPTTRSVAKHIREFAKAVTSWVLDVPGASQGLRSMLMVGIVTRIDWVLGE